MTPVLKQEAEAHLKVRDKIIDKGKEYTPVLTRDGLLYAMTLKRNALKIIEKGLARKSTRNNIFCIKLVYEERFDHKMREKTSEIDPKLHVKRYESGYDRLAFHQEVEVVVEYV